MSSDRTGGPLDFVIDVSETLSRTTRSYYMDV